MTDCERLRDCLLAGRDPSPALEKHASGCDLCAELITGDVELGKILSASGDDPAPAPDVSALFDGLQEQLVRERGVRGFFRSRPTSQRVALLLSVVVVIGALHLGGLLRVDAKVYPALRLAFELSLLGLVAVGGVILALRPHFKTSAPTGASSAAAIVAVLLPVLSIALGPAHQSHAASLAGLGDALLPRAAGCFIYGVVFAAPVVAVAWLVDRGPRGQATFAFAAAATVGANVALWLHCPITHGAHIALGHVPVGVCLLGAALLIRRMRRASPAAPGRLPS